MAETIIVEIKCKDFGDRPECLGEIDEKYTMRFDDIGEEPIRWCSFCGTEANRILGLLESALKERGPVFSKLAQTLIEAAEEETKAKQS